MIDAFRAAGPTTLAALTVSLRPDLSNLAALLRHLGVWSGPAPSSEQTPLAEYLPSPMELGLGSGDLVTTRPSYAAVTASNLSGGRPSRRRAVPSETHLARKREIAEIPCTVCQSTHHDTDPHSLDSRRGGVRRTARRSAARQRGGSAQRGDGGETSG